MAVRALVGEGRERAVARWCPDRESFVNTPAFDFDMLVRENHRVVYQVAYSVLANAADAEDITQDAFVRAHANLALLRDPERFRGWVCRIARNLALNRVRDERRRAAREARNLAREGPPDDVAGIVVDREFEAQVRAAIASLPAHLREVLQLCAIDGLEPAVVAVILELPPGTVRSRLHLARKRLLEALPQ